jgi:hypothetical protein
MAKTKSKGVLGKIGDAVATGAEAVIDAGSKALHAVGDLMPSGKAAPKRAKAKAAKAKAPKAEAKAPAAAAAVAKKAAPKKSTAKAAPRPKAPKVPKKWK